MRRPQRAMIREFWLSIRRGAATEEAAAALGYTNRKGYEIRPVRDRQAPGSNPGP